MATLDFSVDQAVFDNLRSVTFTSVRTAGDVAAAVPDAGVYEDSTGEAQPSHGVYTRVRYRFTIRYAALAGVDGAKPRDTVTLDGYDYTVTRATLGEVTNFWQLEAVRLVIVSALAQSGTLSRPTNAQDTTGRASLATYAAVGSAVSCRLQPEGGGGADVLGRRTAPKRYTAYLATRLAAQAKDRFTVGGTAYTVLEEAQPERLDELPQLSLEEVL